MTENFEELNKIKDETRNQIETLKSGLAMESLEENEKLYKYLIEQKGYELIEKRAGQKLNDIEEIKKHELVIQRAEKKLADIEEIKKLQAKAEATAGIATTTAEKETPTETPVPIKPETQTPVTNEEVEKNSHIEAMENIRLEYQKKDQEYQKKCDEHTKLSDELNKNSFIKIRKNFILERKANKLLKELQIRWLELEVLTENFSIEDRKAFPFAYYLADKIRNPIIKAQFTREALTVKKNVKREYITLNYRNYIRDNEEIRDPYEWYNIKSIGFWNGYLGENKNTDYNLCGLCIEPKNPEEITENKDGKHVDWNNIDNPNAKFKVINHEGITIADNVDYGNALKIYEEASMEYIQKAEEEFKKQNS